MSISAASLIADVTVVGGAAAETQLLGLGVAADADTVALGSMSAAASVLNPYLASLGNQAFTLMPALAGMTDISSQATVALADLTAIADADTVSLASIASVADADTVSLTGLASIADANTTVLTSTASAADLAAASLTATGAAADVTAASLGRTSVIAKESSVDFDLMGKAGEAASFGLDKLKLGAEVVGVALVAAVVLAGNFQERINKLYTSAGESQKNLKMVGDAILKMSVDTATSTKSLADGMYMVESAGFHGAAGLHVLQLAAEGAKAENANLETVANAVTSALNAYHYSADKAAFVTNTMVAAVGAGKMRMEDLASAVSNILPVSSKFGISLTDITAGLATMSSMGDDASAAATHLRQMILALEAPAKAGAKSLASIGLTTQQVTDEMRKSLPDAIQMITDALGKKFPEGTYAYDQALKNIAGGSKQLMGMLELSGKSLGVFKGDVKQISDAVKQGGDNVLGWSVIQGNFNFIVMQAVNAIEALFIKLGTALLPVLSQLMKDIQPLITSFSDWIDKSHAMEAISKTLSGWIGYIGDAFNRANTYVAPFKESIAKFTASYGVALNTIEQTATAIAPLKDAFAQTLNNLDKLGSSVKPITTNFGSFLNTLEQTGSAVAPLTDSFDRATSVLSKTHQIVGAQPNVWIPFWTEILHVKEQIMAINWGAVWKGIQDIGAAISKMDWGKVGAFFSNVASNIGKMDWGKFTKAFEGWVISLTKVDWGKVEEGFSKISAALIGVDWNKIGSDLPKIVDGLSKIDWGGLAKSVNDFTTSIHQMQDAFGAFGKWVEGGWLADLITNIIKWFQHLADTLVGHSIIPDMINNITSWFKSLPGRVMGTISGFVNSIVQWFQSLGPRAMGAINGFIGQVGAAFSGLLGRAYGWGSGLINNIISGIQGASGGIGNALHGLHIPGFASGIENFGGGLAYVHGGEVLTYLPRGTSVIPANQVGHGSGGTSSSSSSGQPVVVQFNVDNQRLVRVLMPDFVQAIRNGTGVMGL